MQLDLQKMFARVFADSLPSVTQAFAQVFAKCLPSVRQVFAYMYNFVLFLYNLNMCSLFATHTGAQRKFGHRHDTALRLWGVAQVRPRHVRRARASRIRSSLRTPGICSLLRTTRDVLCCEHMAYVF